MACFLLFLVNYWVAWLVSKLEGREAVFLNKLGLSNCNNNDNNGASAASRPDINIILKPGTALQNLNQSSVLYQFFIECCSYQLNFWVMMIQNTTRYLIQYQLCRYI